MERREESSRLTPTLRLKLFLVIATALAVGGWWHIGLTGLLLLTVTPAFGVKPWREGLGFIYRLRWLLLGVLLLNATLDPGPHWYVGGRSTGLSQPGLRAGAEHLMAVATVVIASRFAVHGLSNEALIAALTALLAPLQRVHVPVHRLANRLGLMLVVLPQVHAAVLADLRMQSPPSRPWHALGDRVAARLCAVLAAILNDTTPLPSHPSSGSAETASLRSAEHAWVSGVVAGYIVIPWAGSLGLG